MKKFALAAGLVLAATAAAAQTAATPAPAVDIPKPKCVAPRVPGEVMRQDMHEMDRFNRDIKAYKDCVSAYVAERQAASKANIEAGNAAAEEYNKTIKALNEELKQ